MNEDVERLLGVNAVVACVSGCVNAVGGREHRLGLHAEKGALALPAVSPDLLHPAQGTALALAAVPGGNTYIHTHAALWKMLTCKSLLLVRFSDYSICVGPQSVFSRSSNY